MIIMKFGGTSVQDAPAIRRVIGIVGKELKRKPVVVLSACSGVTNELLRSAGIARDGEQDKSFSVIDALRERHREITAGLMKGKIAAGTDACLDEMFTEMKNYLRGIHLLGECTGRTLDAFVSYGERLSSCIVAGAMTENGLPSALVDGRRVLCTDTAYTSAVPMMEKTAAASREIILPLIDQDHVVVTQGFIGSAPDGTTTTLGRGGSDLSASVLGSVLSAEEIQIWTDVDGMMTADPRVVGRARLVSVMSFAEASELAYFGAKVLHPGTILPAVEKNIPVRILNSLRPDGSGTLILRQPQDAKLPRGTGCSITSIAFKPGITVINVTSSRMLMAHGFLARLFSIFAEFAKSVDVISTSEVSVSLTIDNEDRLAEIVSELERIGEVRVIRGKAIVCVVGEGMKNTPGIGARILAALARDGVNIEMVSEGASEINLTLVIDERAAMPAVRILHDEFFGNPPGVRDR